MGVLDSFQLHGKVSMVTGAGLGLGQAKADGLAEAGSDNAGLDLIPLEETQVQIEALGRRFLAVY